MVAATTQEIHTTYNNCMIFLAEDSPKFRQNERWFTGCEVKLTLSNLTYALG